MTLSAHKTIDLKALLYALTQQATPLPEPIQQALQRTGQALQQNQPEAGRQLREQIKRYEPLEAAYMSALRELDKQYVSQQRTKSLSATFSNTVGADWLFINDIIPAADWVSTAKQVLQAQQPKSKQGEFWDRADRTVVIIAGGGAIGGAIAQIPGAIIGALVAAAYAWYINASDKKSA